MGQERVNTFSALPLEARTPVPIGGPAKCDGREHGALSNLALCQIYIDGKQWASVEQYFQASRFRDADYQETIRQVPADNGDASRFASFVHGAQVWRLGQSQEYPQVDDFRPLETMYIATRTKFEQNFVFRDSLLRTSGSIQAGPNDGDWQRLHSLILERVREEVRDPDSRDEAKLRDLRNQFGATDGFDEEAVAVRLNDIAQAHNMLGHQHRLIAMMLDGRQIHIRTFGTDTVQSVKQQLAQNNGISASRIQLILGGQKLKDAQTVAQLGVTDGTILTVIIQAPMPVGAHQRSAEKHVDLMSAIRALPQG